MRYNAVVQRALCVASHLAPIGALNRRICGLLTLAQISQGETSHIPRALSERIFLGCAKLYIRELGCDGIASLPKAGER